MIRVGRVSAAHPPVNESHRYRRAGKRSAPAIYLGEIYQGGEHVPFALMSPAYEGGSHANVQRGLAAAPFAIPAPGGKSALMGIFFSRNKTITLPIVLWRGKKTAVALRLPTLHQT